MRDRGRPRKFYIKPLLEVSSVSLNLRHDKALWPHLTSEKVLACLMLL